MAITPPYNPGFEEGNTGWTIVVGSIIEDTAKAYQGRWLVEQGPARWGTGEVIAGGGAINQLAVDVFPGQTIRASAWINCIGSDTNGQVTVAFGTSEAANDYVEIAGNPITSTTTAGTGWRKSTVVATCPATLPGGVYKAWIRVPTSSHNDFGIVRIDSVEWDYVYQREVELTSPTDEAIYAPGATIPFSVSIASGGAPVVDVKYYKVGSPDVLIGTASDSPYTLTYQENTSGVHSYYAVVSFAGGTTATTDTHTVYVGVYDKEFRASNSYTNLVLDSIKGLSSSVPSTAVITGVEVLVDYNLEVIARTKDLGVADASASTAAAAFDAVDGGTVSISLLRNTATGYTVVGTPLTGDVPIVMGDFNSVEVGMSEGKRWEHLELDAPATTTAGGEVARFGLDPIAATDFFSSALGLRFYPNTLTRPAYADSGDAVYRFHLDKIRVRVYFDAGSVVYYFASPDKTQVLEGQLTSAFVMDGNFQTADASGVLQLTADLVQMDGDQRWIGNDWTIHAAYPPTSANYIGDVGDIAGEDELGMEYNGLPTQQQIKNNRSRYQMITANFYGDKDLNSIYGVNGLSRGFAHNGKWFYKIYTHPEAEKDKPRHVAYHHWHLALGYEEGRVDISVVGEPYNFDGVLGASSWTIGDQVVGLLPLSGTILGVFGAKSVWGIAGTTVDNFATQVISPNIGATEYTICDMGFPVYANAYGIYTLSQTQQYGDFMGVPMSQDISPWLRPRLVRKYTSDREVEVAWPVRSKNQYRLAFSDGYVVSMTMNGQAVPTFSKQKYFLSDSSSANAGSVFSNGATFDMDWWG